MNVTLTLSANQNAELQAHLFPGDGCEAAAIILCGRRAGKQRHRLVAREIHAIPYEHCSVRTPQCVTWPTDVIVPWLDHAEANELTVVKIHSHPNSHERFSEIDDEGDRRLIPAIRDWFDIDLHHGSAVMLPCGRMFGRTMTKQGEFQSLAHINVVGDDLVFWHGTDRTDKISGFAASHLQAYGEGTFNLLQRLSVAVVGCSGTGSPVIEQLSRLGVGELILIDDDKLEERNINRILNATMTDVRKGRHKVDVQAAAVQRMGTGTHVVPLPLNLWTSEAVEAVAQCDLVFGCMDTIDGRYLLNMISTYYQIPYIDLGVRIDVAPDGEERGNIRAICGSVHYLKPGGSSLISRGLFTHKDVSAAGLARTDPSAYARQLQEGYISGAAVERPAVITLNMLLGSLGVNELLARLHNPYRYEENSSYDHIQVDLCGMEMCSEPESDPCPTFMNQLGRGDIYPLLGISSLSGGTQIEPTEWWARIKRGLYTCLPSRLTGRRISGNL